MRFKCRRVCCYCSCAWLYCYATLGGPGVGATPTNSKALGVLHVEVRSLRQGAKQWATAKEWALRI